MTMTIYFGNVPSWLVIPQVAPASSASISVEGAALCEQPCYSEAELRELKSMNAKYRLTNERLQELARAHKPPQSWYEEDSKPF